PAGAGGTAVLNLFDVAGKLVLTQQVSLQPATRELAMNISRLPSGTYRLVCETAGARWSASILKR
ncbi:MAG TPA: hypothetical protein VLD19_16520, partial [Chitinophagaceae bacterium]|nr:hypothetical protein [Chitinophagaceae bacterium]